MSERQPGKAEFSTILRGRERRERDITSGRVHSQRQSKTYSEQPVAFSRQTKHYTRHSDNLTSPIAEATENVSNPGYQHSASTKEDREQQSFQTSTKYSTGRNLCDYCGNDFKDEQNLITSGDKQYHRECISFHIPRAETAVRRFKDTVAGNSNILTIGINIDYLYGLIIEDKVTLKDKKRKRDNKIKELLKYASALRNSGSGYILIHLIGLEEGDAYTGSFDEFADVKLNALINDGKPFNDVYKKQLLSSCHELDDLYDFLVLFVAGAPELITSDFKTKLALDGQIINATHQNIHNILKEKKNLEHEDFHILPSVNFTEDLQDLHESRSVQLKSHFGETDTAEKIVTCLFDKLRFSEYISAFTKLESGGSYIYGVKEESVHKGVHKYKSKTLRAQPMMIRDVAELKEMIQLGVRNTVLKTISHEEEKDLTIPSTDHSRPGLKQLGSSVQEIYSSYISADGIDTAPRDLESNLQDVRKNLLEVLKKSDYLRQYDLLTGEDVRTQIPENRGFVFVSDSLSLYLSTDFPVLKRPENIVSDVFIALPHQPVMVLTLVNGDLQSKQAIRYNVSIASGVIRTFCKFVNECVRPINGVLDTSLLENGNLFQTKIKSLARESGKFVTKDSLLMTRERYDKILTAFWAGVAETTSVVSESGHVDKTNLRFLTKEQCIALVENISKGKVLINCQPGCGATTLTLEVARRLSRLGPTLVVCESQEDMERLKNVHPSCTLIGQEDLCRTIVSKFRHILYSTGRINHVAYSRHTWHFYKDGDVKSRVQSLQKEHDKRGEIIYALQSGSCRRRLDRLFTEVNTLKLVDEKLSLNISHTDLVSKSGKGLLTGEQRCSMTEQVREALLNQNELFPCLQKAIVEDKNQISHQQVIKQILERVSNQEDAGKRNMTEREMITNKTPASSKPTFVDEVHRDIDEELSNQEDAGKRNMTEREMITNKTPASSKPTFVDEVHRDIDEEPSDDIQRVESTIQGILENMDKQELEMLDQGDWLAWEYNLALLSKEVSAMNPFITDILEDDIPVALEPMHKPQALEGHFRVSERIKQKFKLRDFQHGTVSEKKLFDFLGDVIREDEQARSSLQVNISQLEQVTKCRLHILGNYSQRPLMCLSMAFDEKKMNRKNFQVTRDGALVCNKTANERSDSGEIPIYCALSSPPIRLSPHSCIQYWETNTSISQLTELPPPGHNLLEMGVCEEKHIVGELNCDQRNVWGVHVMSCTKHKPGLCTKVRGKQKHEYLCRNDITTPKKDSQICLCYGILMDTLEHFVCFIDLNSEKVLGKYSVNFELPVCPMFGISPRFDLFQMKMHLISGHDILMTASKRRLIQRALLFPKLK